MKVDIKDWMQFWDSFDKDLYIKYLIARQHKEN